MRAAVLSLLCLASAASAQAPSAGKPPAARPLGAVEAKSTELLGSVSTARALSDGKVLVNDALGRRVLLFDKSLTSYTVVADTTPATGNAYASRLAGLIAYKGDTSLFIDPQSMSMLVVDPAGKIGRVMSVPRPQEANSLIAGNGGIPGFDSQGRLVYRAFPQFRFDRRVGGPGATTSDGRPAPPPMPSIPDTMAVVRVELATRKLDTLAFVKTPTMKMTSVTDTSGRTMMTPVMNPLPQVDDWAVLSDGSVAIIRGLDYHVEFFKGDGSKVVSERLPFEWRHLDDSAKQHFVDSAKVAMEKLRAAAQARIAAGGGPPGPMPGMDGGANVPIMVFRTEGGPGGPPRGNDNAMARDQAARTNITIPPLQMVPPNELPDYAPPFNTGAARADLDGNLWVRTSIVVGGGPVYDVISGSGKLIDRVALPPGRVIAGFGKGGVVFMGVREEGGVRLEQARRGNVTP